MNQNEIDRLSVLNKVLEGHLTQLKAGALLKISDRQIRNLLKAFKVFGLEGIISKKRGKPSNRCKDSSLKSLVLKNVSEKYHDFGPTFASEKLLECDNIRISKETLRKWMIETHLWIPQLKKRKTHLLRKRKQYFGEMLQGDGSHHDWFGNDNPCTLLYFIDDATGRITSARFEKSESLQGYFKILKQHVTMYGLPHSIYTDRFCVFETACKKENLTQFQKALKSLDIQWIGANSPQAKGRIERCNRTLQDRLVKEMRLQGIMNIKEGNDFLELYLPMFNDKFSKEPAKSEDLHRPLERGIDLTRTLSKYEERTLTKDLTFQLHGKHYKIFEPEEIVCIGKKVEIRTDEHDKMRVFMRNNELEFKGLDEIFEEEKKIIKFNTLHEPKYTSKPKNNHPWKVASYRKHIIEKNRLLAKL